jgi:hypothetical protein
MLAFSPEQLIINLNMSNSSELFQPIIKVEPQPFEDGGAHVIARSRPFTGSIGKLPLKGRLEFIPRGSSGFDDIPIARVTVTEPPAFDGQYDINAPLYDGQEPDKAGELHWNTWDDQDVIASVGKAVEYLIDARVKPMFED